MSDGDSTDTRKADKAARNKAWREANKEYLEAYNAKRRRRRAEITQAYRERHPERIEEYKERTKAARTAYVAAYYAKNRDAILAQHRANHDPEKHKLRRVKKQYGIIAGQYQEMLQACGNRCSCCKVLFSKVLAERACVDHDHKTCKVRGLICRRCNNALGHAGDDPKILRALARYLEKAKD